MCGIAGHLGVGGGVTAVAGGGAHAGRAPGDAVALVRAMTAALHHRGPDASGVQQLGPAVLGHARLAIIDLSPDANQPMLSADGQTAVVFNGEIYNFADLAAELRAAGVQLRTRSDTEVLLELLPAARPRLRREAAGDVRVRDLGRPPPPAGARARSAREEAAVLPRRAPRAVVRLRDASPARGQRHRAPRRSAGPACLPRARLRALRARRDRGRSQAGARHRRRLRGRQAGGAALLEPASSRRGGDRRKTWSRSCASACSKRSSSVWCRTSRSGPSCPGASIRPRWWRS